MDTNRFEHKRSLGQNFMMDPNVARKLVREAGIKKDDTVLEVGPGSGELTDVLLNSAKEVIAVEIDGRLIDPLLDRFRNDPRFELVKADFLEFDITELAGRKGTTLKVVGNIPYHITSPILFHLFKHSDWVSTFTATVQKEVARRIVSSPGSRDYGILSVYVRLYSMPKILFNVSREVFRPKPKIESTVIHLEFTGENRIGLASEATFSGTVKHSFRQRRKMLRNSLSYLKEGIGWFASKGIDMTRRPETLSLEEFILFSNLIDEWKSREEDA